VHFRSLSVGISISAGMTASIPYVNVNGVSSLLDFIMVRLRFALFTKPLVFGCLTEAKCWQIHSFLHQSLNGLSQNYFPLSEIISHGSTQSIVAKALRIGYYWPTMHKDARTLIRACQDCQVHKPVSINPQQQLTPITSPWPFYKWRIDIAGPFPEGHGKVKFLIVAMDYFTKWIEAKPVATITGSQVKKIMWDNIVWRFGLP
nr:reverse transcriptase domain-containing protein [Tanacetum cinerariifolium]